MHPLHRMRWTVRATLGLGVTVSVAANVLHARPNLISQAIAGWPPIALLLTVELISRIPVAGRARAAVRILATAAIAGIAAWVSYWHMAGVAARYGETTTSAHLMPLSVDGLIVVASICLVELSARIQTLDRRTGTTTATAPVIAAKTEPSVATDVPAANAKPSPPATAPARPAPQRRVRPQTPADPPITQATATSAYVPTTQEDQSMYAAWLLATRAGRRASGAELARAAGRTDDNTGAGRRAARRYRDAHARSAASALHPTLERAAAGVSPSRHGSAVSTAG
jgi:hypothetical protein